MEKHKLVIVNEAGQIPELNFACGPISIPTKIRIENIISMVQNGRDVEEVNPKNHHQRIKLNLSNVKKENFTTLEDVLEKMKSESDHPQPDPQSEPTPVVPEEKEPEVPVEEKKDETSVEKQVEEKKENNQYKNSKKGKKNKTNN